MLCPYCREPDSRVIDSRLASGGSVIWRRRECDGCARRFTTYERVELALPAVLKTDGQREAFDRKKVLRSFQIACNKRPVAPETLEEHAEALERELSETGEKEVTSLVIGERVMERLKSLDEVAYVRFASVYKSFRDIDEFMREMGKLVAPSAQKAEEPE
jgi:transcriptional repressor NrdR